MAGAHAMMVVVAVAALYPLYFVAITAFKTQHEYLTNRMWPPAHPTLENFRLAFRDGEIVRWVANSLVLTVVAALAAYPLARGRFRGQRLYLGANVVLMVIPPVVLVVPLYLLSVSLNL